MNHHTTYRRQILRRLHLIGAAFLALTAVIILAGIALKTDCTAAILTGIFGLTLTIARDSWLDF